MVMLIFVLTCATAFGADNVVNVNNQGVGNNVIVNPPNVADHDNKLTITLKPATTANKVEIDQTDPGTFRKATQFVNKNGAGAPDATGNDIKITQNGSLHEATQKIFGKGNGAEIDQMGKRNRAWQTIRGDDNGVIQKIKIVQSNSENRAWQIITGSVNEGIITQRGYKGWAKQTINGSGNDVTILQTGTTKVNRAFQNISGNTHIANIRQDIGTKNNATQTLTGLQHDVRTRQWGSNNVSNMTVAGQDNEVKVDQGSGGSVPQPGNANISLIDIDRNCQFVTVDHKQVGANNTGWGSKPLNKGIDVNNSMIVDIDVDQLGSLNKADVLVQNSHHVNVVLSQEGDRNRGSVSVQNSDHYDATLTQTGIALTFKMVVNGQSGGGWTKTQN
jgi:hypothetical protein